MKRRQYDKIYARIYCGVGATVAERKYSVGIREASWLARRQELRQSLYLDRKAPTW